MRDQVNEIYALLRERDMRRIGEKRQLENSAPRRRPFYAPLLAYAGVLLMRCGAILLERYTHASGIAPLKIRLITEPTEVQSWQSR